jgi:hypothetical protein
MSTDVNSERLDVRIFFQQIGIVQPLTIPLDVGEDVDMCIHRLVKLFKALRTDFVLTITLGSYKQRIGIHSAPGRKFSPFTCTFSERSPRGCLARA